jgi:hypothetical protein
VRNRRETGMALITALFVMMLLSTMIVGLAWLITSDQKLGGNNSDRQNAFYGAEAGMEALTASLENTFDFNDSPTFTIVNGLASGMPSYIAPPGIQYLSPGSSTANSGLSIGFTGCQKVGAQTCPNGVGNPTPVWGAIGTGQFANMNAWVTPYTLTVVAKSALGSEVKLQREVQTVAIPVFQFGMFSQVDLSFFAGPNFNFGGTVHTNGNLWLAENGNTLTLAGKTTAAGEIITSNLENGNPTTGIYNTTVDITTNPGSGNYADLRAQTPAQSVTGTNNVYGAINAYNPAFATMASGVYNGNIGVKETGVKVINVAIATPSIGGQEIDLIRPPVQNETATAQGTAKFDERYFSKASLRILLSDYDSNGTCVASDIMNYPTIVTATPPIDLATLAWDTAANPANANNGANAPPYKAAPAWINGVGTSVFPLPVSGSTDGTGKTYNGVDGYWIQQNYPTITGCIKIEYQNLAATAWTDVTQQILLYGFTGRNLNPQSKATMSIVANQMPNQVALPGAQIGASACADPSANAIIRLARTRDNPSYANNLGGCGVPPNTAVNQYGRDYWPNVLYDTREGIIRDNALAGNAVTLAGAMNYIELDVNNLDLWFTGALAASSGLNAYRDSNGLVVYFSDRRGNLIDNSPAPASVGPGLKTGGFGYEDIVNLNDVNNGCPNGAMDQGEDLESDYTNGVSQSPATLRVYGHQPGFYNWVNAQPAAVKPLTSAYTSAAAGNQTNGNATNAIIANHPVCTGPGIKFPFATALDPNDLRENPPLVFRRALKLVNGTTITLGNCNSGATCGLTVVSENPVYIQGDFNNPGLSTTFGVTGANPTGVGVGTSVIADAVTLLSDKWNDVNSFAFPYGSGGAVSNGGRAATQTTYQLAIVGGKGIPFANPFGNGAGPAQDYGTDGGAHNFLRFLEDWTGQTLYYRGSIVTFYYSHQAYGTYKCCVTVYEPPTRGYNFDSNFLQPSLLPPETPVMRTINAIGFTQLTLPTQ